MYGAQAANLFSNLFLSFENDVEMYGAQAIWSVQIDVSMFENDVEMYGAQAEIGWFCPLL